MNQWVHTVNELPGFENFGPILLHKVPHVNEKLDCSSQPADSSGMISVVKGKQKASAKQKKKGVAMNINSQDDSDGDILEARQTWELGKQLSLYIEMKKEVLRNLTNLRRSFRKRTTPRHYKWRFK